MFLTKHGRYFKKSALVIIFCISAMTIESPAYADPLSNDDCSSALLLTNPGLYSFDNTMATPDIPSSFGECWIEDGLSQWYAYQAPADVLNYIEFQFLGMDYSGDARIAFFDECGNSAIIWDYKGGDRSPQCTNGYVPFVRYLVSNQSLVWTIASDPSFSGRKGKFAFVANPVNLWSEDIANNGTDAGDLPATSQEVIGSGSLDRIRGNTVNSEVDMYKIQICDYQNFIATTVVPTFDLSSDFGGNSFGALALFDEQGRGISYCERPPGFPDNVGATLTSALVPSDGLYYLAVCRGGQYPTSSGQKIWTLVPNFNNEYPPNGPAAAGTIDGWTSVPPESGSYRIALRGACFIEPPASGACCTGASCLVVAGGPACINGSYQGNSTVCTPITCCPADFDHNNTINVSDIFAFLRGWFARNSAADIDGNGQVQVSDIFAFLRHWFAHC